MERMMDDTLTTLSLDPMVTKLTRKSLRAQEKSGRHSVTGRNQKVSGVVRSARLCVACQERRKRNRWMDGFTATRSLHM